MKYEGNTPFLCHSKRHISENVLPCDDSFKTTVTRVCDWQTNQVEVAEHVQNLLKTISALRDERCLNHVRAHVDHPLEVVLTDVLNFTVPSILRVEVWVEDREVKLHIGDWDFSLVTQHGELAEDHLAVFDLLHFWVIAVDEIGCQACFCPVCVTLRSFFLLGQVLVYWRLFLNAVVVSFTVAISSEMFLFNDLLLGQELTHISLHWRRLTTVF